MAEGWLSKNPVNPILGGLGSKTRLRWFVLRTTALKTVKMEYYTDDSLSKLKGTLMLTPDCELNPHEDVGFRLVTKKGTLVAATETPEDRDAWVERLAMALDIAKRARSGSVRLAAERAAERRAREAAQLAENAGGAKKEEDTSNKGCYLLWSEASDGSLVEHWDQNKVDGCLARFLPQKKVAKYKYKRHGGNSELLRDIRTPARLFKGIATFCKTARESDGLLQVFPPKARSFRVYVNVDGKLRELENGKPVDTRTVKAVAVVGKDNETFVGIARMEPMQFVQHATGMGGFGAFLVNEQ